MWMGAIGNRCGYEIRIPSEMFWCFSSRAEHIFLSTLCSYGFRLLTRFYFFVGLFPLTVCQVSLPHELGAQTLIFNEIISSSFLYFFYKIPFEGFVPAISTRRDQE